MIIATLLVTGSSLTSCAGAGASSTEPMLSAAGFRVRTPETATQRQIDAGLPPYRVQRGSHQGETF